MTLTDIIPLTRELGALPHPARLLPAFLDMPYPALLDGVTPGVIPGGRFSYLSADPFLVVRSRGRRITIEHGGIQEEREGNPWDVLQDLVHRYRVNRLPGLPPFQGGVLGYWSYDLGRHLERLPSWAKDDLGLPEMYLGLYDWALAYDGVTGESYLFSTGLPDGTPERARRRAEEVLARLHRVPQGAPPATLDLPGDLESNFTKTGYMDAVRQVKEYLKAGPKDIRRVFESTAAPF